jgi:hypothetical protein
MISREGYVEVLRGAHRALPRLFAQGRNGFFEESLHGADALVAEKFIYVRVDCDICEPAGSVCVVFPRGGAEPVRKIIAKDSATDRGDCV